ncbi:MAG: sodium:solute symporter [Phycisphaerae bacterium]
MGLLDWLVVGAYFTVLIGIVWWASQKQDTTADYFLAGRNVGFLVIGASLFASNIGSEHVVGLAGQGATTGMAMAHYELHAWIMLLLAWVFVPFYYRSAVYTVPEFLEKRFSATVRMILSVVSLLAYVFTKVSVTVYAGAKVFQVLLPETFGSPENAFWIGAIATVILTGIYTIFGGLRAVLYTDTVQAVILLIGSVCITTIGLNMLGGWGELQTTIGEKADRFALWRPIDDPDFPWLGILIGSPIVGIWYWCTDQYIVQRTLSAKDLRNARRGALFGGVLKVLPVLLFIIPGLIGYALHERGLMNLPMKTVSGETAETLGVTTPLTEAAATEPVPAADGEATAGSPPVATQALPDEEIIDGDRVFASLVTGLLPSGLRGLVVAGLLAALMSSLSSLFNSSASLFTKDIYERLRPGRTESHLVNVGRVATGVVVVLGLLWIPVMSAVSELGLYNYLQQVQGYLAPPITSVFLLGLFWRRINHVGATAGLLIGFALGMGKMILQDLFGAGTLTGPGWLAAVAEFNFLYFSSVLFGICVVIVVGASLATRAPEPGSLTGLTYGTRTPEEEREIRESWNGWDIFLSLLVAGLVLGIYIYFSFWL